MAARDFKEILDEISNCFESFVVLIPISLSKTGAEMLQHAVKAANTSIQILDLNKDSDWKQLVREVEVIQLALHMGNIGAKLYSADIARMCGVIYDAINIGRNIRTVNNTYAERNQYMLDLLASIGAALIELYRTDKRVFSVLGDSSQQQALQEIFQVMESSRLMASSRLRASFTSDSGFVSSSDTTEL